MTYEQIAEMMEEMGLPFAYHHFAEGESPAPPFLLSNDITIIITVPFLKSACTKK